MEKKRSNGLTALCILSWVWMALSLLGAISNVNTGRLSDEAIRAQKIVILESQTPETMEMAPWIVEESIEMLYISQANFGTMVTIDFVALLIGLAGVFLMFQMRKIGYHLYIGYSILSLTYWLFYFGGMNMGLIMVGLSGVFSILFILLYGTQVKKMN